MKSSALTSFVAGVAIAAAFGATAAQAEKTKFELWHGLSGDLGDRVQDTCKKFNESQAEFEIVCTSQNDYESTLQNTIAAYRAKSSPPSPRFMTPARWT